MENPVMGSSNFLQILNRIAASLESIEMHMSRVADQSTSTDAEKVGTSYVAKCLGCTTVWVAEQSRDGRIPVNCIVEGTGHGKPWKFYRSQIDKWMKNR